MQTGELRTETRRSVIGSVSSSVLPGDLTQWLPSRLRTAALMALLMFSALLAAEFFRSVAYVVPQAVQFAVYGFGILSSATVMWVATNARLPASKLENFGLWYAFLMSAVVWTSEFTASFADVTMTPGIPTVCVWLVLFPLIVPSKPRKTLITSSASFLAGPIIYWIFVTAGTQVVPSFELIGMWFAAALIAAAVSVTVSLHINKVAELLSSHKELGSYRLDEVIGKGGMGEVWRASHKMMKRPAAIKMIRKERLDGGGSRANAESAVQRFRLEAQTTAELRSPHTVELYDYGMTDSGDLYYVMEYLDGIDLQLLVERHGPQPPERVIRFMLQTCESLEEAHRAGLVHRDVKPGNIVACRAGIEEDYIKVLDFGTVRPPKIAGTNDPARLTEATNIVGTPGFMAPEAIMADAVPASDIYSLGCVAYWLLTGRLVFHHPSPAGLLMKHVRDAPTPPSAYAPNPIPQALEDAILDCLAKEPEDRPRSAMELAGRLAEIEVTEPWDQERAREWWHARGVVNTKAPYTLEMPSTAPTLDGSTEAIEPLPPPPMGQAPTESAPMTRNESDDVLLPPSY